MTLKAISIAPNNYQNPVELDRVLVDSIGDRKAGVLYEDPATPELKCAPGAGHTIDVAVGKAIVREKVNPTVRGAYFFQNDAVLNIAMPVPQSQPFIATVIAVVTDPQYGAVTGAVGPRIDVISGTPASSPAAVSDAFIDAIAGTPGGWTRLCDIRINTADTTTIPVGQFVDMRAFTLLRSTQTDRQVFTATGTWTKPPWAKWVRARLVGGGGAGGGGIGAGTGNASGAGGGGAGYCEHVFLASALNATEAVVVGTGGTGNTGTGNTGANSTFKTLTAYAGLGGIAGGTAATNSQASNGGNGGGAAGGNVNNVTGSDGGTGRTILGVYVGGAFGGASMFGGSSKQTLAFADGTAGGLYGGGGAGALVSTVSKNGGAGGAGLVIIESW